MHFEESQEGGMHELRRKLAAGTKSGYDSKGRGDSVEGDDYPGRR